VIARDRKTLGLFAAGRVGLILKRLATTKRSYKLAEVKARPEATAKAMWPRITRMDANWITRNEARNCGTL
jgi:hypothetical protein